MIYGMRHRGACGCAGVQRGFGWCSDRASGEVDCKRFGHPHDIGFQMSDPSVSLPSE